MKIQIDIGHPGHVHLFKNVAKIMQQQGHEFLFTCREKEFELELLQAEGFRYVSFGKKYKTTIGKILGLFKFDLLSIWQGLRFRPDLLLSHGSPYASHTAAVLRKPHISMEDTGNMEQVRLYLPFTACVLTSTAFHKDLGDKQISYDGYHELAYLHPDHFTPDPTIYNLLGITEETPYVILRFVSWNASHDINQSGLTLEEKRTMIAHLQQRYSVFISAEGTLPDEFSTLQIKIPPQEMHHALAHASMFIGEGATMASECAVLGTPAIYINTITAGTITEQMEHGLLYHFTDGKGVLDQIKALEALPQLKAHFQEKKERLLRTKIDVASFLVWFLSNYPESKKARNYASKALQKKAKTEVSDTAYEMQS